MSGGGYIGYAIGGLCQMLSNRAAHVVVVKVKDNNRAVEMSPHGNVIRLAPPLVISEEDLDWALDQVEAVAR